MRYLAIIAILLFAPAAHADAVYLHGLSQHYVDCANPCNETNEGISYKRDLGDNNFWHAGAYHNTQYNPAAFAVYGLSHDWHGIELGAAAGIAIGYVDRNGVTGAGIVPAFVLSAEQGPLYVGLIPGAVTVALRVPYEGLSLSMWID